VRWLALAAGGALVAIAFLAGSRVADTREGLISEVIALFSGLAGVLLILYGWVAASIRAPAAGVQPPPRTQAADLVRSANDLLVGSSGLVIAAILIVGIVLSAGLLWAALGLVLLMPMVIGSAYLCWRFLRSPQRDWRIDLQRLTRLR
jgi:hypothetical protein